MHLLNADPTLNKFDILKEIIIFTKNNNPSFKIIYFEKINKNNKYIKFYK